MKKAILFLLFVFVLCGCSAEEQKEDKSVEVSDIKQDSTIPEEINDTPIITTNNEPAPTNTPIPTISPTPTNTPTPIVDKDVEIISRWIDMSGEGTIEDYVAELNSQESDIKYKVYNEECYSFFVKESERVELIDTFLSDEAKKEILLQINESYPGVYTSIEFDDEFSEIKVYANKEKYDESDFFVSFVPTFIFSLYGEMVQSYKLVPIEERFIDFYIIDDKTNEVIYTPSE